MGCIMKVEIGSLDRRGSRAIRRDFAHVGALKLPVTDEGISIHSVTSRVFQYLRRADGSADVNMTLSCEPKDDR
jgi:hypothetical protein